MQVQLSESEIQYDIILERDNDIMLLHNEMRDVNELFQTVATLIDSQSPMIDNIQNNIRNANDNCKTGADNLGKAEGEAAKTTTLYGYILAGVTITLTLTTAITTAIILL